jgi:hypothetical protein
MIKIIYMIYQHHGLLAEGLRNTSLAIKAEHAWTGAKQANWGMKRRMKQLKSIADKFKLEIVACCE